MTSVTFHSGSIFNDGSTPPNNLGAGGHRTNLIPLLAECINEADLAIDAASEALASATAAATSATAAANAISGAMKTTCSQSKTSDTGAYTFVVADNLDTVVPFVDNSPVIIVSRSNAAVLMYGRVTGASGTSLQVTVTYAESAGTIKSDWDIFATGLMGITGTVDINGATAASVISGSDKLIEYNLSATANRSITINDVVAKGSVVVNDNCRIEGTLAVQDYVVGHFNNTCTLNTLALTAGSGSGTVVFYLSPNETSASGTAITGGSFSASTTYVAQSLTANNTVTAGTPKYLIAKCTGSTSLRNLTIDLKQTKTGEA